MDDESLTHAKREYKYHIVFAPKYRRRRSIARSKERLARCYGNCVSTKGRRLLKWNAALTDAHAGKHTAQDERIPFHGVHERRKGSLMRWCDWGFIRALWCRPITKGCTCRANHRLDWWSWLQEWIRWPVPLEFFWVFLINEKLDKWYSQCNNIYK